jgi:hypothetical protein
MEIAVPAGTHEIPGRHFEFDLAVARNLIYAVSNKSPSQSAGCNQNYSSSLICTAIGNNCVNISKRAE